MLSKNLEIHIKRNGSLRSLKQNELLRDKFENIIKRGVIGEFSHDVVIRDKQRRNKKKNNVIIRDKRGGDFDFGDEPNLQVYQ